jgi:hypothetical protein
LIRKLTLKRVGKAINKVKVRKNGYDTFNYNRKQWSNNARMGRGRESTYIGEALTTSIMLAGGRSKERWNNAAAAESINLF